jgi:hypothetical protein
MRVDEAAERATAYYEDVLWRSELGESIRGRLADLGVEEEALRAFRVGYAPGDWDGLLDHLAQWDYSSEELDAAGIAQSSRQGRVRVNFRSRIIFPVIDPEGRILGFAGLATNPGPSWPQWVTSPEGSRYRRASALFGLDQAGEAIAGAGEALVVKDCVDVLRLHQRGRREAVAVIRSNVTPEHLAELALPLGADPAALGAVPFELGVNGGDPLSGVRVSRGGERTVAIEGSGSGGAERERTSTERTVPDAERPLTAGERVLLVIVSVLLGLGLPAGWLLLAGSKTEGANELEAALVPAVGGVALSYAVLAVIGAAVTARLTARSRSRRMRQVWEIGSTEWQPPAWTYHRLEEVLIGAALISIVVLVATFLASGALA